MTTRSWTDAQRAAIAARRRTLVAAAAGSGKTSVLTELVAQALVARELAPSEVCAVTFTEKAAQEMRERVADRLHQLGERDLLADLELARIGTIHSLCATILRAHGTAVGLDPGVGILDDSQGAWVVREAVRHALESLERDPDVHWLRARMGDERIEETLRALHQHAAQRDGTISLPSPEDVQAPIDPKRGEPLVAPADVRRTYVALHRLWDRFHVDVDERKHALGRISFDDLERLAVDAVRIPEVATALRATWTMVLVDEFQDTNERQYELLDTIGGDRLFMVGDEWQSIYRFRGADVDVFRARRADPTNGVLPMRENFRSAGPVLDVVNHVFGHEGVFGEGYEPVLAGTDAQRAVEGPAVELLVVPEGDGPDVDAARGAPRREREALRVAQAIAELVESRAATPGEIAVLYARGSGIEAYERAIAAWGIPVLRAATGGYYDQRDVRDALVVLAAIRNHADDHAALGLLAGPIGQLSWSELAQLADTARDESIRLLEAARSSTLDGARRACSVVEELGRVADDAPLVQLVSRVVSLPQLELGAASEPDGLVRIANLRRLVELAASAEQVGVRGVAGFLEFVDAQRRDARVGEASIADETVGAVRLLTIHASKGLEFPHVFVVEAASASSGRPGTVPRPLVDEHGLTHVGVPRRDGRCERTPALAQLQELAVLEEREEALRLWYVAMTRAKSRLYVSGRWNFEPKKDGTPRSVPGALAWLRDALQVAPDFGGVGHVRPVAGGAVLLDTRPAHRTPTAVWNVEREHVVLAEPLTVPQVEEGPTDPRGSDVDPHALRSALRDALDAARSEEWRQLDGTRVHDAVARLLDAARSGVAREQLLDPEHGPWLTDGVRRRLQPVVGSAAFARLTELRARTEVPYVAGSGSMTTSRAVPGLEVASSIAAVDAGRIDALAELPDARRWVVDWKSTLPTAAETAWSEHGPQLTRYARTLTAAGASEVVVTLVSLAAPTEPFSWCVAFPSGDVDAEPSVAACDLP